MTQAHKRINKSVETEYLRLLRNGFSLYKAADEVGFSYAGIYRHRQDNPDFDAQVKSCQEIWDATAIAFAEQIVMDSIAAKDSWAVKFLLQSLAPERWGEPYKLSLIHI